MSASYFERIDRHRYKPTAHASGAWDSDETHFSPLAGLVVHAIDGYLAERPHSGLLLSRISFDILGRLALDECEIRVESIRPGRTIELLEAVVDIAGRTAVRARAWLLTEVDTGAAAGGGAARLTPPDAIASQSLTSVWPGGHCASIDFRPVVPPQPGRTTAWISTHLDLVAGEPSSSLASYVALVDTANGIAVRRPPTEWMFPNVDLTVHLHRRPEGRWVGMDTTVVFGPTGQGLTSTVLHDVHGPVGQAQQTLTVRPLPGRGGA
ncbi:thioesterase family protein [Streptomyces camelliae]|uniref:Thioesterase family protein n=1 Tax=Streptomyces camelliae TaxID=3004093 RepID=A0ABY7NX45_9ACTN|nr:thioesterase family protein [Streptomyces sp. HUAS 2-6]WBO62052.1 thioesterase family protein [Streptomyces sp. HUAS 2-6]